MEGHWLLNTMHGHPSDDRATTRRLRGTTAVEAAPMLLALNRATIEQPIAVVADEYSKLDIFGLAIYPHFPIFDIQRRTRHREPRR